MASCNGQCQSFNTKDAKWFKIDAAGYDSAKKQWASTVLINGRSALVCAGRFADRMWDTDGDSWTSTIPASIASGEYVRCYSLANFSD